MSEKAICPRCGFLFYVKAGCDACFFYASQADKVKR